MRHLYDFDCACTKCQAWRLYTRLHNKWQQPVELPDGTVTNPKLDREIQEHVTVYRKLYAE